MRIVSLFHEIDEMLFNLMPLVERYEGRVRFGSPPGRRTSGRERTAAGTAGRGEVDAKEHLENPKSEAQKCETNPKPKGPKSKTRRWTGLF